MSEEQNNRKKSIIGTVLVQVVLLLALYFIVAWKEPFPPIEEYGIELSFVTAPGSPQPSKEPITRVENSQPFLEESLEEEVPPEDPPMEASTEEEIPPEDVVTETLDVNSPDARPEETETEAPKVERDEKERTTTEIDFALA